MLIQELERAVDSWATSDPSAHGYGYSDSQNAWSYNPAIDQPRLTFHSFLEQMVRGGTAGSVLEIGLGRHGGSHAAFCAIGARVVTVEIDAERVQRFIDCNPTVPGRDEFVVGDSSDGATLTKVQELVSDCDLLFLDGGDSYEQVALDWAAYAPLVRAGGVVAIVDRSQSSPVNRRSFDVDWFALQLKKYRLDYEGVHLDHVGKGHCIHYYVKPAGREDAYRIPAPQNFVATPIPRRVDGDVCGYSMYAWDGEFLAIQSSHERLDPRGIDRCEYDVVLKGRTIDGLRQAVQIYAAVVAPLRDARRAAIRRDVLQAEEITRRVLVVQPGLREALLPSLEVHAHQRELLLTLSSACLFGGRRAEGVALARKVLEQDYSDTDLLMLLGNAYLYLLKDKIAAIALIRDARERMRESAISNICMTQLTGHLLWSYPQFFFGIDRVVVAGGGTTELLDAFSMLGISDICFLEPDSMAFGRLRGRVEGGLRQDIKLFGVAASDASGRQTMWSSAGGGHHSSLRLTEGCAGRRPDLVQTSEQVVEVWAIDDLVAQGRFDARGKSLLMISAEGAELLVLGGAIQFLAHVEVVCVKVCYQDVYVGSASLDDVRDFLSDQGFRSRAGEPCPDGVSGFVIFAKCGGEAIVA